MKTKKEGKFTLDKFEVAKLKNPIMKKIVGGLVGGNETISITDVVTVLQGTR